MPRQLIHWILLFTILCGAGMAQTPSTTIAIVDVNVIPMDTERVLEHQTVLIRNGRIAAMAGSLAIPAGVRRIDGKGKFLTPGLIDAHVHLMSPDDLISYLAYGVTTVVNMSGTPADLKLRREVRSGARLGPNIYTAGPTIDGNPPLNEVFVTAETAEHGAAIVESTKRAGYDFIKVYGTLRPDVFRAIAEAGRREHMALTGHINRQIPVAEVFGAGEVLAAHVEDLIFARFDHPPTDDELTKLADEVKAAGITVTANVAINEATTAQVKDLDAVLAQEEAQYLSAATFSRWIRANNRNLDGEPKQHLEELKTAQAADLKFIRMLHDRNVPIILGTDASAYGFPGLSVWSELELTEAAGLSRFDTLATATRNTGKYLADHIDSASRIGVIREGARADLVLWNINVLEGKLTRSALAGVFLRGRWLPTSVIDARRAELKKRLIREHEMVQKADAALEQGDVPSASRALNSNDNLLDEWVLLTKARKQEADPKIALDIARLYTREFPDRFSSHLLLSQLARKAGRVDEARTEARRALALQPGDSTAINEIHRISFSSAPAKFLPGDYEVRFAGGDAGTLHVEKKAAWGGTLTVGNDGAPLREISAGDDELWFKAGQDFAEKEIRLTITPTGSVTGTWWSMFGRNGTVSGRRIDH